MDDSIKLRNDPLVKPLRRLRRAILIGFGVLVTVLIFTGIVLSLLSLVTGNQTLIINHFVEPVGNATSAHITISPAISRLTVSALPDSTTLFDADVTYKGTLTFDHTDEISKTVSLKQDQGGDGFNLFSVNLSNPFANDQALLWNVHLSPNVLLDLSINSGVGVSSLDLGHLKLANLNIFGGVGPVALTLPNGAVAYPVRIEVGVGSMDIQIQQQGSINLQIKGGVGSIHLSVPRDVGVRLILNSGLGSVNLLPAMQRVGGSGTSSRDSIFETTGFSSAPYQISIGYEAGVGSFTMAEDQSNAR